MSSHPINLGLRFVLELAALAAVGVWGWHKGEGWLRYLLALGIPVVIALLWAVFRVPNDPGSAPIAIPGLLRLLFELAVFGFAVYALADAHLLPLAWILGIALAVHYITSYDRILWLLGR
jgi:hypothetical protein